MAAAHFLQRKELAGWLAVLGDVALSDCYCAAAIDMLPTVVVATVDTFSCMPKAGDEEDKDRPGDMLRFCFFRPRSLTVEKVKLVLRMAAQVAAPHLKEPAWPSWLM